MGIKNFRHGRITIKSGDATPLEKIADFSNGNFTWTSNYTTNEIRDRGSLMEITKGDDEPIDWSFSAKFQDKTLMRTLRDKVWAATTENLTGLTAASLNAVVTAYDFEQGSVAGQAGQTIVKLANGADSVSVNADNELAEGISTGADVEGVIKVSKTATNTGTIGGAASTVYPAIYYYPPTASTTLNIVYDAVGKGTIGTDDCSGSRKTFVLILQVYDPCDPPSSTDSTAGTVLETYTLDDSYLASLTFTEADEFDEVSFSGRSLKQKIVIT